MSVSTNGPGGQVGWQPGIDYEVSRYRFPDGRLGYEWIAYERDRKLAIGRNRTRAGLTVALLADRAGRAVVNACGDVVAGIRRALSG